MGLVTKLAKTAFVGGAATLGTFFVATRKSTFVPIDPTTTPLFNIKQYQLFNPNKNPTMHDDCMRSVPLNQIKPELLEKEGELVKAFCAGVWGGPGYTAQRLILKRKYFNSETKDQLWEPKELKESSYPVGTQITDHFEVVEHDPSSIVVRCGDTPRKREVRPVEGVFEMAVDVKPEQGVAEFHMRSIFWQGEGKTDKAVEGFDAWLHRQYAKIWMESALFNVRK